MDISLSLDNGQFLPVTAPASAVTPGISYMSSVKRPSSHRLMNYRVVKKSGALIESQFSIEMFSNATLCFAAWVLGSNR